MVVIAISIQAIKYITWIQNRFYAILEIKTVFKILYRFTVISHSKRKPFSASMCVYMHIYTCQAKCFKFQSFLSHVSIKCFAF